MQYKVYAKSNMTYQLTCLSCAAAASFWGLRHTGHVAWSSSQGVMQSLWNICSHLSWFTDSSKLKSSQHTEHCAFWSTHEKIFHYFMFELGLVSRQRKLFSYIIKNYLPMWSCVTFIVGRLVISSFSIFGGPAPSIWLSSWVTMASKPPLPHA